MYAVIMAGGIGTRFWPLSRAHHPKQLLNIIGSHSMIQETVKRIKNLIPIEKILIITNKIQADALRSQLPELPKENIIEEPIGRNTAACIGLAALLLKQKDPDSTMIVLPSDHLITPADKFLQILKEADKFLQKENFLLTMGVVPTFPHTGYGYIHIGEQISSDNDFEVYQIKQFTEKPDTETAEKFFDSKDYFWNSGMFIWKTKTILDEIKEYLPDLYQGLQKIEVALGTPNGMDVINQIYPRLPSVSIDYGIMEKTKYAATIRATYDWNDIGSWEALETVWPKDEFGNTLIGKTLGLESTNNIIYSPNKTVALIGVDDLIIVETDDVLLVCSRKDNQKIGKLVKQLYKEGKEEYL